MMGGGGGRSRSGRPVSCASRALLARSAPAALCAFLLLLLASCGTVNRGDVPTQHSWVKTMDKARTSLFKGDVEYDDARRLKFRAGHQTPFEITVSGSWRNSGNGKPHKAVKVGAEMGVQLHCHGDASCQSDSSRRQPVLDSEDRSNWTWWITPHTAGPLTFSITVTTYFRDSDTVLDEQTIPLEAHVDAAPRGFLTVAWDWVKSGWVTMVGLATSLAAVWGTAKMITSDLRRRTRASTEEPPATDPDPSDAHAPSD